MHLFRILLIISVMLLTIPLFNALSDYLEEKTKQVTRVGEKTFDAAKHLKWHKNQDEN